VIDGAGGDGDLLAASHLVALRTIKITAGDPPSTWWPGER
jgi:hypothetical protein